MKTTQILLLVTGLIGISGCGGSPLSNAISNDSGIDTTHDANGNKILADTPKEWADFVLFTNVSIKHEMEGNTHWGSSKNANDAWVNLIHRTQTGREHPQKYIDYIIEQRRKAGLPELVGYP